MSYANGPKIVTDGLVLCLDAANRKSYPLSGSTIYDLSGNGYDGTFGASTAAPTFTSANGGVLNFDGNDTIASSSIFSSYPFSVSMWVTNSLNWVAGSNQMDQLFNMSISGQRVSMGIVNVSGWPGVITLMYGGTSHWTCPGPIATGSNDWHNITWVVYGSNNSNHKIYLDSVSQTLTNNGGAHGGTAGWNIGSNNTNGEHWHGKISNVLAYNRTLSADEVRRNYNALKGRYGLT